MGGVDGHMDMKQLLAMQEAKDIENRYVMPKMKFDTIYDEYIEKQKMFSHLKSAVNKQDDDTLKQELETLKTKIDMLKKI